MLTYVLAADGSPLMPTYNIRKVRHMLRDGRAVIAGHKPGFTIRLAYGLPEQEIPRVQPVELCEDTGQKHIGVSVKSEKHEYAHLQVDPLKDEKQRHDDRRRYRRARRNRKRYRKPRFDNRKKPEGWIAPSLRHIADIHGSIVRQFTRVLPITSVTLETGSFDTQKLEAQQAGTTLPIGKDYQHGKRYQIATLRKAVFYRDGYTCQCCGRKAFDEHGKPAGVILRMHHALYWKGDHTDRMSGLMTVCTRCHTGANHRKGGNLWGLEPKGKSMAGAAFMNTVRWMIFREGKTEFPDIAFHNTWGARTDLMRRRYCIGKSHANDAFVMGDFHPKHRAREVHLEKKRRNNRVLSKFYDAKYIDIRDGERRSGQELSCGRTNRSESRQSEKYMRPYRGQKVSKGRTAVRRQHYPVQPGDMVLYRGKKLTTTGMHCHGTRLILDGKSVSVKKVRFLHFAGGYQFAKSRKEKAGSSHDLLCMPCG